jgi:hypothetical protein
LIKSVSIYRIKLPIKITAVCSWLILHVFIEFWLQKSTKHCKLISSFFS